MSKLDKEILDLEKLNKVIKEQLPGFASSFFKNKRNTMSINSLYGYSVDISMFFRYLEATTSISPKDFSLKDLNNISEADIENFLKNIEYVVSNGQVRKRSDQAIRRCFFALNCFFTFFYKEDLIDTLPTFKVTPPANTKACQLTSPDECLKLLDFVANGKLIEGRLGAFQEDFRERDTAIIALMLLGGLKISEIIALDIIDLRLGRKQLIIRTRKHQVLTLSDVVVRLISSYLNIRLNIISLYGHENALFLSSRCQRIANRTIQLMFKKYVYACFGNDCKIVPNNLAITYKNVIYNQCNNLIATSLLTGCDPDYLASVFRADLNEKKNNTELFFSKTL